MDDFNAELVNMLHAEKLKTPSRDERIERERREITAIFCDHVIALRSLRSEDMTVEAMLQALQDDHCLTWEDEEEEAAMLNEVMEPELERFPDLLQGEMKVTGEGLYVFDGEEVNEARVLEPSQAIHGEIGGYSVAPLIMQDATGACIDAAPAVWVALDAATVVNAAGKVVFASDRIIAPFTGSGLEFAKVIRQDGADMVTPVEFFAEPTRDLVYELNRPTLNDIYRDIENDLNTMQANGTVSHQDRRREHLQTIIALTERYDRDIPLTLSAKEAVDPVSKQPVDVVDETAYYNGPTIVQYPVTNQWRVVYGFSLIGDDGVTKQYAHVLPAALKKALYKDDAA